MSKKLKIGIIGVGGISESHIVGYRTDPDVELYAFCDINEARLQHMGEKYGVTRLFTKKEDLLALPEIDAVSVCTWNSQHAPCTIAALDAGKHVLCEKPMATNEQEAQAMLDAAKRNNRLLMIGFVRRFGNDCKILKDMIDNGTLGELYYSKATYLRRHGNPGGWFGDKSRSGGGPLIDLGVHVLDLTRYLMGNPKPVSVYGVTFHKLGNRPDVKDKIGYVATSASPDDVCDVEDFATAMVRFDNGAVITLETSFSLNLKDDVGRIEMFGTEGGAKLEPELELYTQLNGYMADVTLKTPTALSFNGLFENEIHHYLACVRGEATCMSPAEDGVMIMRILDAIYKSAATGHEVML